MLKPDDFPAFFAAIYDHEPFPWQTRLAATVTATGRWPALLDLPTGTGKTAVLDVAVFHLACEAHRGPARSAPLRILFVVDRRIVVDAAFDRAWKVAKALGKARDGVLAQVAERLQWLAGDGAPPLDVVRLRGGIPQERDWARSPVQPLIAVSTVDQVGSRLLFRGYGVSPRMWPVHAGLVGADALWLLDEVHLSGPLEETLDAIVGPHEETRAGKQTRCPRLAPFRVVKLTATPGGETGNAFRLTEEDHRHEELKPRLTARKMAAIKRVEGEPAEAFATHALRLAGLAAGEEPKQEGMNGVQTAPPPVRRFAVVVNRVDLARQVYQRIKGATEDRAKVLLLTGRIRPLDRERVLEKLEPLYARKERTDPDRPVILVSTQTIEAGADLDFDALVTEIAPLDSLRQRFGRLDRLGQRSQSRAVILHPPGKPGKADSGEENPWSPSIRIYGESAYETLKWLQSLGDEVDFGSDAMAETLAAVDREELQRLLAPRLHAPVLLPPYADLWAMTSPAPAATPEPSLFLHGPTRPADVLVVWRTDVGPDDEETPLTLEVCPPSALEALPLPVWAVQRWLRQDRGRFGMADVPEETPDAGQAERGSDPSVWCWDAETWWRKPVSQVRPGDMVVIPAHFGRCDQWGWAPQSQTEVADLGAEAHYRQRLRGALSVTEASLANALARPDDPDASTKAQAIWGRISRLIADLEEDVDGEAVRAMLAAEEQLPDTWRRLLVGMAGRGPSVESYDNENRTRGLVIFAAQRLKAGLLDEIETGAEDGPEAVTGQPDSAVMGPAVPLPDHLSHVELWARTFAARAGLDERLTDLVGLAGRLHDVGKADLRFQADLRGASALAARDPDLAALLLPPGSLLAKSTRARGTGAGRQRTLQATPMNFRHEALSVAMAANHPDVARLSDDDRDLVLWLIGTHHGYGRPFFPACIDDAPQTQASVQIDDTTLAAKAGDAPLQLDQGWFELAQRVSRRYGPWELARLEAVLRLADHTASAREQSRAEMMQPGSEGLP